MNKFGLRRAINRIYIAKFLKQYRQVFRQEAGFQHISFTRIGSSEKIRSKTISNSP
jgi:hypothetical protein